MKKARKVLSLLLAAILVATLCSCGGGSSSTGSEKPAETAEAPAAENSQEADAAQEAEAAQAAEDTKTEETAQAEDETDFLLGSWFAKTATYNGEEKDPDEVMVMRYTDDGELQNIEDDEEYNEILEVFNAYQDDPDIQKLKEEK